MILGVVSSHFYADNGEICTLVSVAYAKFCKNHSKDPSLRSKFIPKIPNFDNFGVLKLTNFTPIAVKFRIWYL